jgi:glutamyl-tRNA synthetase
MVLLRADGTPTYMLSVVVDDHDMAVTHVIRGDDHLTNTFRQIQLYRACGWDSPVFSHIPLIHGPDGAKLSKRHGALGADAYRDLGILPEALRNYLLRLGWSHGDEEIIDTAQAIAWFDLDGVGRSPARFDLGRLTTLNGHYLRQADDARLVDLISPRLAAHLGHPLSPDQAAMLIAAMPGLKERAKTLVDLADGARFLVSPRPLQPDTAALRLLDPAARKILADFAQGLAAADEWRQDALEEEARRFAAARDIKLGALAQPLRAALTGSTVSPPIFDVLLWLGKEESLGRIADLL